MIQVQRHGSKSPIVCTRKCLCNCLCSVSAASSCTALTGRPLKPELPPNASKEKQRFSLLASSACAASPCWHPAQAQRRCKHDEYTRRVQRGYVTLKQRNMQDEVRRHVATNQHRQSIDRRLAGQVGSTCVVHIRMHIDTHTTKHARTLTHTHVHTHSRSHAHARTYSVYTTVRTHAHTHTRVLTRARTHTPTVYIYNRAISTHTFTQINDLQHANAELDVRQNEQIREIEHLEQQSTQVHVCVDTNLARMNRCILHTPRHTQ